jgi:hypothetical protein|tara:strand:+ start:2436 stop:4151 length:1716 start_codon:yes stop_codon:yes gene_type:complete
MMPGQMMPTTGIEQLGNFQDSMNSRSGLDRLRAMQTLGLMSLANDTYMEESLDQPQQPMMNPEQPMMQQGLSGLPQVQAGFGGFLKNVFKAVTRPIKAVVKGVSKFAKSKIGKMIVPAALAFAAPWAMGLSFSASPFLYSAAAGLGSGLGSLVSGAKPGDALKSALIGGLATYAGGSLFNKFGGAGSTVKPMTGASTKVFGQNVATGAAKAAGTGGAQTFGSFGTMGTGAGTVGSQAANVATAIPSALTGSPLAVQAAQQAAVDSALTNVGLTGTAPTGPFSSTAFTGGGSAVAPSAAVQPGAQSIFSGDTSAQAFKNLPKQLVQYGKEALTKPETYGALARDMAPSPFDQPALSPEQELEDYGFTRTPNSLGLQEAYYVNPDTGQEMSITDAMAYMRSKSQGITGAQRRDQATQVGGFGNLAPQLKYRPTGLATSSPFINKDGGAVIPQQDGSEILRSSGGLMGYAYGGQLPEFSGQVPGEGHGMEDNVSFPITERQGGGEVQIAEGRLSPDEYVVDANTMSLLGNGSSDAGAKIMDETIRDVRMAATGQKEQQKQINGLQALSRMKRNI